MTMKLQSIKPFGRHLRKLKMRWAYLVLIVPILTFISCEEMAEFLFDVVKADLNFPTSECEEIAPKSKSGTLHIRILTEQGDPLVGATFQASIRFRELKTVDVDGDLQCIRLETSEVSQSVSTGQDGKATMTSPTWIMKHNKDAIEFYYTVVTQNGVADRGVIEFDYNSSSEKSRTWEVLAPL